ncbi:MAG: glycosyl transferase family 1 [Candidatus Yanofskybacteria bacterium CG10_big_fil_rev_8_21_14_0_10_36_16]|uniref:Glycosyl transferase family 1 n=1 Tax=Candidatus Yanofskybacteria bacterium CG10_big_fil_rev_8_21_14_0_10_36_16 TaxID=1975096 RepID=A0A2J0Q7X8_9BACT|nr:MAG: glycosyl transferase family 1 [Candidatus Yanofskybacteria bacterium CG10_big_fil_rev_8_21_14_0_10_36_16]
MKTVILYAYPPEPDGLSMQGHMLYRGMKENGQWVLPANSGSEFHKNWIFKNFNPDVALGVGQWSFTPDIIEHPAVWGVTPVPWLVANGWVANYQDTLSSLPLVFSTSDWVTQTYERDGVDTKNFETLQIGLNINNHRPIPKTHPKVRAIRELLGIREDEVVIMTAGGDVTSKGAQEVFKALKKVNQEFKNWKYVCKVWGGASADDHYEDEMRLIRDISEDAEDKVVYVDGSFPVEFMPYFLAICDVYIAPSRLEGFGMIQVEAQACGKPVISIDAMGPKETIKHGETGFLAKVASTVDLTEEWAYKFMGFEEDHKIYFDKPKTFAYRADVDELAKYLLLLLTNPNLREKMGHQARKHAVLNFEYHYIADKATKIMKERFRLK